MTVLGVAPRSGPGPKKYRCRCVCGREKAVVGHSLKRRATTSCGCRVHRQRREAAETAAAALVGSVFGRLTVLRVSETRRTGGILLSCLCSCGRSTEVPAKALRAGVRVSCGCFKGTKLPGHTGAINELFHALKKNAATRELGVSLTRAEFENLILRPCVYCGDTGGSKFRNTGLIWNGIDREDSSLGYTTDNCVTCCKTCNYAKRRMTRDEFFAWVKRVATHQNLFP
jgi:hypothetical protein